jgi:ABC-type multidrug transport system fused ATPase/permease subunit
MTAEAILSFHKVDYGYAKGLPDAVNHLDFTIPPASITAILGPNGAGKTTLLHLALGLFHPRSGEIQVGGKSIQAYSRRDWYPRTNTCPMNSAFWNMLSWAAPPTLAHWICRIPKILQSPARH